VPGPWQNIKKLLLEQQNAAQVFIHHLKLSVGNGKKIRFWKDQCVGNFTLKDKFPSLFRLSTQQSALISSMGWFEGHLWKLALAWKRELAQQEVELVEGLIDLLSAHFLLPNQEDTIHWKGKKEYSADPAAASIYGIGS